ncbi:MAG: LPS assembly protein LptD [Candidatus Aminicenantes bacterium]|nr:LPS assembly protein LptD [Candidatus Aminicenantes bacterium]
MHLRKSVCFLVMFLLTGVVVAFGSDLDEDLTQIKIIAHHKERIDDKVTASGNVEVHYKEIRLFADWAELDLKTKDVIAEGSVSIHLSDGVISAEQIQMNLETSRGQLERVHGLTQPNITYEAQSMKRESEDFYKLKKAWITSCTQEIPRWKFSCSRGNYKQDDYIEMWNSVFRIKKIPIFYLPYMRYPVGEERSTGFLMPSIGYSGNKGMTFEQGFYWAMRRNMDATAHFNYYSERGFGGGLQYRYIFSEKSRGQMELFSFRSTNPEYQNVEENAYILRLKHSNPLPLNFNLTADVDYQSSFDFLREFDNNFRRAVVANRRSQVYLTRSWSYFNFNARVSRFETYFRAADRSIISHSLPQVSFSSSKIKLFSPLYLSFGSAFKSWEYGWDTAYENGTQKKAQYASFNPKLSLPFNSVSWFTLNSDLSSSNVYYFQSYKEGTKEIVNEPFFLNRYTLNMEFIGPVFNRVYFDSESNPKLKHIIEPSLVYRFDSPVENSGKIISATYFYTNHYVRYGLTNRFLIKKNDMPREILSLRLSQTFYLNPEDGPLRIYRIDGEIPEFSDINGNLRFYPTNKYSLDASASFNLYYGTLSTIRMGANLGSPNDDLFLRLNWYKSINPYREGSLWARHQISVYSGWKIPAASLEFKSQIDYNFQEKKLLYSAASLVYHYQCLDFAADLRVFYFRDKPEIQFGFSLELGNIGRTQNFLGGFGF